MLWAALAVIRCPVVRAAVAGEDHHVFVADLADAGGLEEVEFAGVLVLVERRILRAFRVAHLAVAGAGGDEIVVQLRAGAHRVHRLRVQLDGGRVLEAVERIGAESAREVGVFLVCHRLDEDRGVEVDDRAGQAAAAVGRGVDRAELVDSRP